MFCMALRAAVIMYKPTVQIAIVARHNVSTDRVTVECLLIDSKQSIVKAGISIVIHSVALQRVNILSLINTYALNP